MAHFLALGFYGVVVGLYSFAPLIVGRMRIAEAARLVILLASPLAALVTIMAATGSGIGGSGIDWDFSLKLRWLVTFMNINAPVLSFFSAAVVTLLVTWLMLRRGAALTPTGRVMGIGLLVLYLALPRTLFDVAFLDIRVLTLAALVLPAFVTVQPSRGAALIIVAVVVANVAVTMSAWAGHQRDYAEFRSSFTRLVPGSAVLLAIDNIDPTADAPLFYAATLAVPERDVFVPSFYAAPETQPVVAKRQFRDLVPRRGLDYLPVTLRDLDTAAAPPHTLQWRCRYRFLYVLGQTTSPLSGLRAIAHGRRFVLYRIVAPPACKQA